MTETKEKKELIVQEKTHPETYFDVMDRYFNRLMRHPSSLLTPYLPFREYPEIKELTPSVDIFEDEGHLILKAELPGIRKEDLNVTIAENRITLSGEKKQEERIEKENYHWCERTYGSFSRSFQLPDNVNPDGADASFKDGVLKIRIPKTEEARRRKIDIK
jgi:HSP20 family protein